MRRSIMFLVSFVVVLHPAVSSAYEPTAAMVDGQIVRTSEKKPGPWHADLLKHDWGGYPFEARRRHWEGTGWFRLQLRPDGSVGDVKVVQSTGHSMLDQSAMAALQGWRFKPGKWKWVDEPLWYSLHARRL